MNILALIKFWLVSFILITPFILWAMKYSFTDNFFEKIEIKRKNFYKQYRTEKEIDRFQQRQSIELSVYYFCVKYLNADRICDNMKEAIAKFFHKAYLILACSIGFVGAVIFMSSSLHYVETYFNLKTIDDDIKAYSSKQYPTPSDILKINDKLKDLKENPFVLDEIKNSYSEDFIFEMMNRTNKRVEEILEKS